MGLILIPSEIKNCADQVRANIEKNREGYAGALQVIEGFAGNEELKSESWDTAKQRIVECHQMIVMGIMAAQDSMTENLSSMEAILESDHDLYEDELLADILRLQEECERYENAIETISSMGSRSIIGTNTYIFELEGIYQQLLSITREELLRVREKLEQLYLKSNQSSDLFLTISTLLQAVDCAINDAEVYITGTGTLSDGSWKVTISDTIKSLEEISCKENVEVQYMDSTRELVKKHENIWWDVVNSGEIYSIGYGCDFTAVSDPDLYKKYVEDGESITQADADALLDKKIVIYVNAVDAFISSNNLVFNQNQYDVLVSFFYNNGAYVFSEDAYNDWINSGVEEKEKRAEARKRLEEYLISANGCYDDQTILQLFVDCKGPNIKYEYTDRRTEEANLFNSDCSY